MTQLPRVGDIAEIPLRTNRVRIAKVIRHNADAVDWRRCSVCNDTFGYGPIGQHVITGELVCLFDCTK